MRDYEVVNTIALMNKLLGDSDLEFSIPSHRTNFNVAICKNLKGLQKHMDILQEVKEKDAEWKKYNNELISICEKYSNIENSGIIKDNTGYKFTAACTDFLSEKQKLVAKYEGHTYEEDMVITAQAMIKPDWLPINRKFLGNFIFILSPFIEI